MKSILPLLISISVSISQSSDIWLSKDSSPYVIDIDIPEELKGHYGIALNIDISSPDGNEMGTINIGVFDDSKHLKTETIEVKQETMNHNLYLCERENIIYNDKIQVKFETNIANSKTIDLSLVKFDCSSVNAESSTIVSTESSTSVSSESSSSTVAAVVGCIILALILVLLSCWCYKKYGKNLLNNKKEDDSNSIGDTHIPLTVPPATNKKEDGISSKNEGFLLGPDEHGDERACAGHPDVRVAGAPQGSHPQHGQHHLRRHPLRQPREGLQEAPQRTQLHHRVSHQVRRQDSAAQEGKVSGWSNMVKDIMAEKFAGVSVSKRELRKANDFVLSSNEDPQPVHTIKQFAPEDLEPFSEELIQQSQLKQDENKNMIKQVLERAHLLRTGEVIIEEVEEDQDKCTSVYGIVVTIKETANNIIVAHACHNLKFQLDPMKLGSESKKEIDTIKANFGRNKALTWLQKEGLIPGINYIE